MSQLVHFKTNDLIIQEKQLTRNMYIIHSGKVRVYKDYLGKRITLAILGEGEIFGELSFFDAEPRSASVQALSNCELIEINPSSKHMDSLPPWIMPVLKKVFHRFRAVDEKITILQSVNEFKKVNQKVDSFARTIYLELLRYFKAVDVLVEQNKSKVINLPKVTKNLDDLLGKKSLDLSRFWKVMFEYNLCYYVNEAVGDFSFETDSFSAFSNYVKSEVDSERFLNISHSGIAVIRRIIESADQYLTASDTSENHAHVKKYDLKLESIPLWEESLKELHQLKLVKEEADGELHFSPTELSSLLPHQQLLKGFDVAVMQMD